MSQTLIRGLEILLAVGQGPRSINDIAQQFGVHHSTALRLLHTLESEDFVARRDGKFTLGSRVVWLGQLALEQIDLRSVARPSIEQLSALTGETVHLATLVGSDVVYVDKAESIHSVRMYSQIGKVAPLHATGVAKAIASSNPALEEQLRHMTQPYTRFTQNTRLTYAELAIDLAEGRQRGFLFDDREHEESIRCIAVPIKSSDGISRSAVSIAVPVHRCDLSRLLSFAPEITRVAEQISAELGYYQVANPNN